MEIIIVLISRLLVKKDAYNLIKNATIIDKKEHYKCHRQK